MNKDQLKAAFAKGARIQAWHLLPGATNSNQGQWDTLTPKEGAEPEFGCEAHLYRVHPEDISLIAELGQEVVAVAQHQFRTMYGPGPDDSLPWANCDADFMSRFSHRDNLEFRKLYTSPAHTSEAREWRNVFSDPPKDRGMYEVVAVTDNGPEVLVMEYDSKKDCWIHEGEPTFCHGWYINVRLWRDRAPVPAEIPENPDHD